MPIYIIKCINCNIEKEIFCKYSDLEEMKCPECSSNLANIPCITSFKVNGYSYKNGYGSGE